MWSIRLFRCSWYTKWNLSIDSQSIPSVRSEAHQCIIQIIFVLHLKFITEVAECYSRVIVLVNQLFSCPSFLEKTNFELMEIQSSSSTRPFAIFKLPDSLTDWVTASPSFDFSVATVYNMDGFDMSPFIPLMVTRVGELCRGIYYHLGNARLISLLPLLLT